MEIKRIIVGQLQTNCYLLTSGGEAAVVDPGDEAPRIAAEVAKTGAAVKFIINTHNHFDHIGADNELKKIFKTRILIDKNDDNGRIDVDETLKDGKIIRIGADQLKIIETPGHTGGSVCLLGDGFVISGDTLFEDGFGRTDLPGGSAPAMAESLKKIDWLVNEGDMIYPGHGNIFKYKKGMALAWLDYVS